MNGASWRALAADTRWAEERRITPRGLIALATFAILTLELALIRWTSGQVRAFAYINNIVLITAFLGMGVGVALGRRWAGLVHFALPVLLIVALPLALSETLGLVTLAFPDQSIALWGAQVRPANLGVFVQNLGIFLLLLAGIGAVFVCAGAPLGHLFARGPVLGAYTADLAGSLAGVVAFTIAAWLETGPVVWFALGVVPLALLSRRGWTIPLALAVVTLAHHAAGDAQFSPYNRIVLVREPLMLRLDVNRDFHQYLHDVSDARLASPTLAPADRNVLLGVRAICDLPFRINPQRGAALVVGAGTGNDVQAALRNRYREVTSVDIDGRIIAIGRAQHPEQPYRDPRARTVVDDARSFFERRDGARYDVVCYGLLDSHAMVSAMSTLRLDNYVYTEEGIRAAWRHVSPEGHLSLAMSCMAGAWFFERLYWTIAQATGRKPVAIYSDFHGGMVTFIVPNSAARIDTPLLARLESLQPRRSAEKTLTLSDDWPFLYLRPNVFPWGYAVVLGAVLAVALLAARRVFGVGRGDGGFDAPLFLMGAAFLLIETRGVTSLSLLFGSTWIVNSAVFAGILTMVLLATLAVARWRWRQPEGWFVALFATVMALAVFPLPWLHALPLWARGAVGGCLTGLPVGIAGVIVPMLLARAKNPAVALGSNLLGAVLGGCLEYFSMLGGMRSTALMALVLYLIAFLLVRKQGAATTPALAADAAPARA